MALKKLSLLLGSTLFLASACGPGAVGNQEGAGGAVSALNLPTPARYVRRWAPVFMTHKGTYTAAEAVDIARRFDVVSGQPNAFRGLVPQMRAVNPNIKVFIYENPLWDRSGSQFPESTYLRTRTGAKVNWIQWSMYSLDPRSAAVKQAAIRDCQADMTASGADGCLVDNVGSFAVSGSSSFSGIPLDPLTGQPFTPSAYMIAAAGVTQAMVAALPKAFIAGNGYANGPAYFKGTSGTSVLAGRVPGVEAEVWLRSPRSPITAYPGEAQWKQNVDMLADSESKGTTPFTNTKLWTSGTQAQRDAWHEFALASFMLGTTGRSYFAFINEEGRDCGAATAKHPIDQLNVGSPTAGYTRSGNVYSRTFSNGRVLVNPTTSSTSLRLPHAFRDASGSMVTSVSLAPHSARILVNP